jgi:hypothetical protein
MFERFDFVIDKATLDAISCGGEEEEIRSTNEFHRVLKTGAQYLLISYSRFRIEDFLGEDNVDRDNRHGENEKWLCKECISLVGPEEDDNNSVSAPSNLHYLYILTAK